MATNESVKVLFIAWILRKIIQLLISGGQPVGQ